MNEPREMQPVSQPEPPSPLEQQVAMRFAASMAIADLFFTSEADRISQACLAMAKRFHRGGRLIAFGSGASATDAQHVSVEFLHPVIVGKRALPALALTSDSALLSGISVGEPEGVPFGRLLAILGREQDMAMGFSITGQDENLVTAMVEAKKHGLLTLGLTGGSGGTMAAAQLDFCFTVPSADALVVQETHETLYHILWELVHIFFEHEGLLE